MAIKYINLEKIMNVSKKGVFWAFLERMACFARFMYLNLTKPFQQEIGVTVRSLWDFFENWFDRFWDPHPNFHGDWELKFRMWTRNFGTAWCTNFWRNVFVFSVSKITIYEILEWFELFLVENEFFEQKIHFQNP